MLDEYFKINSFTFKLGKFDYDPSINSKVAVKNNFMIGYLPEIDPSIIEKEIKKNIEANSIKYKTDEPSIMEQSFLLKYWYIILPVVVLFLFGGNGPIEKPVKK